MKYLYNMESVIIVITTMLCAVLLLNLGYRLRSVVPWRVNCWFCNNNFWLKFGTRNSWICPKCEQYNGFTKDGDYNKNVIPTVPVDRSLKTPMVFQRSPPRNGLCKMCNINQQLKVAQLANFVPMNERKFDEEIEVYRAQLEKAYKLCSPCRKVLQNKLHKEKEYLLGSKVLQARTPDRDSQKKKKAKEFPKKLINSVSMAVAIMLLVLVSVESYKSVVKHKNFLNRIQNIKLIVTGLLERITSIVKMKLFMTFPSLENCHLDLNRYLNVNLFADRFNINFNQLDHLNDVAQMALGGFACFIQIIGHFWSINNLKYTSLIDILWSVFVLASVVQDPEHATPINKIMKLSSISTLLLVYNILKTKTVKKAAVKSYTTPKKKKNFTNETLTSSVEDEHTLMLDTDDDVSLSKFGIHNLSDNSDESIKPMNERSFTPKSEGIWTKPKLNTTFCVNSLMTKSSSSVSDNVFIKPAFHKYQNLTKDDSDSELDESISSLCISSPKKSKSKMNSIFSLRKFTATPNFVAPTTLTRARPLISPSKLGHSTSWVAGGYWGLEGERQNFNLNGSRSSSQSSGFESQTSSVTQRNIFSQPPSREESVCGEPDRAAMLLDRFQNCNVNNFGGFQNVPNYSHVSSPVFPQMQYNGHVHIPQRGLVQQQYVQTNMFKVPGGSGLIKLPQDAFAAR